MRHTTKADIERRHQRGFAMLEVLVSVLVLAIGLLGLAALQSRALQFNYDAYVRSQASLLGDDIIEVMRSVRTTKDTSSQAMSGFLTATLPGGTTYDYQNVSGENEVKRWLAKLGERLPGGTGEIRLNTTDSALYDIVITWTDRRANTTRSLTRTVRP